MGSVYEPFFKNELFIIFAISPTLGFVMLAAWKCGPLLSWEDACGSNLHYFNIAYHWKTFLYLLQKRNYNSRQFSDEVNISVSITPTTLIPSHINSS